MIAVEIARTHRLRIRKMSLADAPFALTLLNEPSWIEFIGDKNVHNISDAEAYLQEGPIAMYEHAGMGMYLVEDPASQQPVGMCGLLQRETLPDVDLGLAFMPSHWGAGFAQEAAAAVLAYGRDSLALNRIVAITLPSNAPCIALLERLGFRYEQDLRFEPDNELLRLYGLNTATLSQPASA